LRARGIARSDLPGVGVKVARVAEVIVRNAVRVAVLVGLDVGTVPPEIAVDKHVSQYRGSNGEGENPRQHCFA